jgi:hypothetical protein
MQNKIPLRNPDAKFSDFRISSFGLVGTPTSQLDFIFAVKSRSALAFLDKYAK